MTTKVLFWDFDGLMVDSEWCAFEASRAVLRDHAVNLTIEDYRALVGLHDTTAGLARLLRSEGRDVTEDVRRAQFRAYYREYVTEVPLLPGVASLLERTASLGLVNWIVSSSTAPLINRHRTRLLLKEFFAGVVGSESTTRGKPSPTATFKDGDSFFSTPITHCESRRP